MMCFLVVRLVGLMFVNDILVASDSKQISFFGDDLRSKIPIRDVPVISSFNRNRNLLSNYTNTDQYQITLTIEPSQLTTPTGFQSIQISWMNATVAGFGHWIGLFSPTNSTNDQYLDFFYTNGQINGTYTATVWNLRDNFEARYFSGNDNNYKLECISNIATVIPNQPLQGHLSLTKHSPKEMQIRWVSSLITNPSVQIGKNANNYTKTFDATYYSYDTTFMCGSDASNINPKQFRHPGYIYTAIVNGLDTDTRYYYRFGNEDYWSDEESFLTSSSDLSKTFGFIMYGDQGTNTNSFLHIAAVENEIENNEDIKFVLHIGDLSYAWGYGYVWDKWCNMISKVSSSVPYMISIGNHEYDHLSECNNGGNDVSGVNKTGYHPPWGNFHDDSKGECGVPPYFRFKVDICNNQNSIFWYSFNYHSVHFIVLSSEHNYSQNTDGYNFLVNDLKNNSHNPHTSWIIVNIHRPLYQSEIYTEDNVVDSHLVELLEPVFYQYKIDLVLAGHYHSYERTCAMVNYTCIGRENNGIIHLTIGSAGFELDTASYVPNEYILFRNEIDFGYGKFFVNDTMLIAQYVTLNNGVIDQVILTKKMVSSNTKKDDSDEEEIISIVGFIVVTLCIISFGFVWWTNKKVTKQFVFNPIIIDDDSDENKSKLKYRMENKKNNVLSSKLKNMEFTAMTKKTHSNNVTHDEAQSLMTTQKI